jgi:hypothetical protein
MLRFRWIVLPMLLGLAACASHDRIVRSTPGTQAEASCAATGLAADSKPYQDCLEALGRNRVYAPPGTPRSQLNSLYYRACVNTGRAPVSCSCLMNQLEANGVNDDGLRSLLVRAGVLWPPPGGSFINIAPIELANRQCKLSFP